MSNDELEAGMDYHYRVTVLCSWHEVSSSGFESAIDAYEYLAEIDEIGRDDVVSVKIERVKREENV